jgi:hypothetical protein
MQFCSNHWDRGPQKGRGPFLAAASKDNRNSQNQNLKNNIFVDTTISKYFVIYPSGEISLRTALITGTLEFWKRN